MQDSQVKRGISTNAKLALGLGLMLLVAVGGWFGLHLAGAVPGPLSGFMDHGAAGGASGAPQVPLSREPVNSKGKGRVLLVEPVGGGSLSARIAGKVRGLSGIRGVRAFLLVRQRDGAFVQGVSTGGGRALAFAAGRPVAVTDGGRLEQPGGAALAGVEYAKSHNTAYGYPIIGMASHQAPIELGSLTTPIAGLFRTDSPLDEMLVVPLGVAQRAFGRSEQVSGFWVTVADPAAVQSAVARAVGSGARVRAVTG